MEINRLVINLHVERRMLINEFFIFRSYKLTLDNVCDGYKRLVSSEKLFVIVVY